MEASSKFGRSRILRFPITISRISRGIVWSMFRLEPTISVADGAWDLFCFNLFKVIVVMMQDKGAKNGKSLVIKSVGLADGG